MLNQVVLVGRLTEDPTLINTVNGKKVSSITLAVQRTFKNQDGIYEADFIRCILWNAIAASTTEYCHKGDIVGVKGANFSKDHKTHPLKNACSNFCYVLHRQNKQKVF